MTPEEEEAKKRALNKFIAEKNSSEVVPQPSPFSEEFTNTLRRKNIKDQLKGLFPEE